MASAFAGLGVFCLRRLTRLEPDWPNAYLSIWVGFCLLLFGLLVWNFFLPINEWAFWTFTSLAVIAIAIEYKWFAATLGKRVSPMLAAAIGAVSLWTANHCLAPAGMDDYNYEFQAARWFHDYRVVPGLANLDGRIGFNNSHHLLAALLNNGPWAGATNHILNGFFVTLAFALAVASIRNVAQGKTQLHTLFGAALAAPCVWMVLFGPFGPMISTLKADILVSAAIGALSVIFTEFLETPATESRYLPLALTILLLTTALISVKATAVAFCGILFVFVAVWLFAGGYRLAAACGVLIAALVVSSVLIRGVILSGYPLYPFSQLHANVDWLVPPAQMSVERALIHGGAEHRTNVTVAEPNAYTWIPHWFEVTLLTDKYDIVLPAVLAILCLPWLVKRRMATLAASRRGLSGLATIIGAALLSLSIWFIEAPAGRFGFIYFWILFGLLFAAAVGASASPSRWKFAVILNLALMALTILVLARLDIEPLYRVGVLSVVLFGIAWTAGFRWASGRRQWQILASFCAALALYPVADRALAKSIRGEPEAMGPLFWLPVHELAERQEKPHYDSKRTREGLVVHVAKEITYEMPLPSTKYFNPLLECRRPGDLGSGFRNRSTNLADSADSAEDTAPPARPESNKPASGSESHTAEKHPSPPPSL